MKPKDEVTALRKTTRDLACVKCGLPANSTRSSLHAALKARGCHPIQGERRSVWYLRFIGDEAIGYHLAVILRAIA